MDIFDETPKNATSPISPLKSVSDRTVAVAVKGEGLNPKADAKIIASGRGKLAEEILRLAFEKGVKVREDADLAELLATLDLDTPIPSEAILAVAEVLAKVYEINTNMVGAEKSAPTDTPTKG